MQDMGSLSLILVRLGDKVTVVCIKTETWAVPLIIVYLMYLLHQMICHPTENIIHNPYVFVTDDAFQMKNYMLNPDPLVLTMILKREFLIITFREPAALSKTRLVFLQLDLEYLVDLLTLK